MYDIFYSAPKKKFANEKLNFAGKKYIFTSSLKSIFRRWNVTFCQRNFFFAAEKKIRRTDDIGTSAQKCLHGHSQDKCDWSSGLGGDSSTLKSTVKKLG